MDTSLIKTRFSQNFKYSVMPFKKEKMKLVTSKVTSSGRKINSLILGDFHLGAKVIYIKLPSTFPLLDRLS